MENNNESSNLHTYIFIGRSGCGKGSQVERLAEHFTKNGVINNEHSWLRVETGARFREFALIESHMGTMVKKAIERGERMPDNFAIWNWTGLLFDKFTGAEHLFFDGCPRSLPEVHALESFLIFIGREKPVVVYLDVSRAESKRRLLERGRKDDDPEDIDRRLDWFDRDVLPAVEYYRNNPKYNFVELDGEQTREKIHEDLIAKLEG